MSRIRVTRLLCRAAFPLLFMTVTPAPKAAITAPEPPRPTKASEETARAHMERIAALLGMRADGESVEEPATSAAEGEA